MFLKDYTVAVRRYTSQTRNDPRIYEVSPTQSWIDMINAVFPEREYRLTRHLCLKIVAQNFVGLVQIKNFSTFKNLIREYTIMVMHYRPNLLNPIFWVFVLGTLFLPRRLLLPLVDWYSDRVVPRRLRSTNITFTPANQ